MQTSTDTNVVSFRPAEDTEKRTIMDLLDRWVRQRPGLEARAYIRDWQDANGRAAYRDDARTITRQLRHARAMMRYIELRPSITGADIREGFDLCSGRLTYTPGRGLDYCVGQYWAMEYRAAACNVMASILWDRFRADIGPDATGDSIREMARRELGTSIARRWFR
jgi:hypothetical protein